MRKTHLLMASTALVALLGATAAPAQESNESGEAIAAAGTTAGGAITGFIIGGPIGAIIGGFAGATIGAVGTIDEASIEYAASNPVEPIYFDRPIDVGYRFEDTTFVEPIPNDPNHGYVYANGRVYIVDTNSYEVVYSPGYVVPERTVAFVQSNPTPELQLNLDLEAGMEIPADAELTLVPEQPAYSYAYINGRPVIVDNRTRLVIWAG